MEAGKNLRRWIVAVLVAASVLAGAAGSSVRPFASHPATHMLAGPSDPPWPPPR